MLRTGSGESAQPDASRIAFPFWVQDLGPGEKPQHLPPEYRPAQAPEFAQLGSSDNLSRRLAVIRFALGSLPDWQEAAVCFYTDPETFFPEKGQNTRAAKQICGGCEVKDECLEFALAHDERFGVWGGLSKPDRDKLKRRAI